MKEKKRAHYKLFLATTVLFWFSMYIYVPELSTYAKKLGADFGMIGLIAGAYGLTQIILRIPLGLASDRFNKRKMFIQLGLFSLGVSALITYLNPSPVSLFLTRLTAGMGASTWVIFTIYFSKDFHANETVKSVGILQSFNAAGQLLAMLVGGVVSYFFEVRALYLLAAVSGVVAFALSLFLPKEEERATRSQPTQSLWTLIQNRSLVVSSILAILSQVITFGTAFGFVPILASNLGADNYQMSFLTALAIIPALLFSRLSTDLFARKLGKKPVLKIGFAVSAVLCILMPWIGSLPLLFVAQFVSGIGRSMTMPLLMGLSIGEIHGDQRATAMGIFQATYGVGMVAGPVLLGFIADAFSITAGFAATGIIGLVAIFIVDAYDWGGSWGR